MKNLNVVLIITKTGVDDIIQIISFPDTKSDDPIRESLFNRRFI